MTSVSSRRISPSCRSARWKAASGVAAVLERGTPGPRGSSRRGRGSAPRLDQHGRFRSPTGADPAAVSNPLSASSRTREADLETWSRPRLAVDADEPAVLLHDPVHRGEPQAGPLAGLLRREERLEDRDKVSRPSPAHVSLNDSAAYSPGSASPWARSTPRPPWRWTSRSYRAHAVDGVPRVHGEVREDLRDLGKGSNRTFHRPSAAGTRRRCPPRIMRRSMFSARRSTRSADDPRRSDLLTGEGEELRGEGGGPPPAFLTSTEVRRHGESGSEASQRDL